MAEKLVQAGSITVRADPDELAATLMRGLVDVSRLVHRAMFI